MSNIATFSSLNKKKRNSGSDDDDNEQGQAFYAGGSERSGQQVLGPSKRRDPNDLIADMFKAARENGAQVVDEAMPPARESGSGYRPFAGAGHTLAGEEGTSSTTTPTAALNDPTSELPNPPRPVNMCLKMWKDGFSIDDGQLRSYTNEENADFLRSIKQGEVPRELIAQARGGEVNLNMEDYRHEEYKAPKRKLHAFSGSGHRLGNVTQDFVGESITVSSVETEVNNDAKLEVDESQPITSIQIRLSDSSRLVVRVNLTNTISDIRHYICSARPNYATQPFILMTTFPNTQLTDESLTIEQANLQNAVIVQRFI